MLDWGRLNSGGGGGGGTLLFFDRVVPQPTSKWGSKELTGRTKYRVLETTELTGQVKKMVSETMELMAEWKNWVLESANELCENHRERVRICFALNWQCATEWFGANVGSYRAVMNMTRLGSGVQTVQNGLASFRGSCERQFIEMRVSV